LHAHEVLPGVHRVASPGGRCQAAGDWGPPASWSANCVW
jgi:hypothetical protein